MNTIQSQGSTNRSTNPWSSETEAGLELYRVLLEISRKKSLKKLYSRALLLAVDFEFEHGVNYLLNNKKNFFNITDLTSELLLLDEVSIFNPYP